MDSESESEAASGPAQVTMPLAMEFQDTTTKLQLELRDSELELEGCRCGVTVAQGRLGGAPGLPAGRDSDPGPGQLRRVNPGRAGHGDAKLSVR